MARPPRRARDGGAVPPPGSACVPHGAALGRHGERSKNSTGGGWLQVNVGNAMVDEVCDRRPRRTSRGAVRNPEARARARIGRLWTGTGAALNDDDRRATERPSRHCGEWRSSEALRRACTRMPTKRTGARLASDRWRFALPPRPRWVMRCVLGALVIQREIQATCEPTTPISAAEKKTGAQLFVDGWKTRQNASPILFRCGRSCAPAPPSAVLALAQVQPAVARGSSSKASSSGGRP